uniref:Ribosomal RNA apurinic site specific lyase-like n=1 Tax=Oryza sativa subsp. japonica TaxID=39947 RepID=Q6Z982_ORYSJ|nr:ribosomal RNA apurinic site specific lyase-like [Oryza sativa Japonica Group]BAD03383.1 ribosomal RNA apurinic site specific lyase-like [Oryza sativa Japonica Group]
MTTKMMADSACTVVLSPCWRRCHIWASTPLVSDNADLHPDDDNIVSRVLAAYPSHRCIRLTNACSYVDSRSAAVLSRWLGVLAAKGVQELILVFLPIWPMRVEPPADVLCIASLHRLYLGLRRSFPDTEHIRLGADVFPYLIELGICRTNMKAKDLDRLLRSLTPNQSIAPFLTREQV